jgi:hypothetical protein
VLIGIAVIGGGVFLVHKAKQAGVDSEMFRYNPGLAVAKMITAVNPDVEVVSVDDHRGLITLREKSTGKTSTITFDRARHGRITFSDSENSEAHTLPSSLPAWIPSYPHSKTQGNFSVNGDDGAAGNFTFTTTDAADDVISFYEGALKRDGFRITSNTKAGAGDSAGALVSAEDAGSNRTVVIAIGTRGDGTTVNVTFAQK